MAAIPCDPPLDWPDALAYLAPRATAGVESIGEDGRYALTLRHGDREGWLVVGAAPGGHRLLVDASYGLAPVLPHLAARLRRLFDLGTDPRPIAAHLARDPRLAPLVARRPYLRLVCAADGFGLAVRGVLGQAVTVRGASRLAARLATLLGQPLAPTPPGLDRLPVAPEGLARARPEQLTGIGITRRRAECLLALARATVAGELPELVSDAHVSAPLGLIDRLTGLPGIGPWTAHYVAMRVLGWGDAFPEGDLGLRKAMGGLTARELRAAAERWRPWRAYAARHLWAAPPQVAPVRPPSG